MILQKLSGRDRSNILWMYLCNVNGHWSRTRVGGVVRVSGQANIDGYECGHTLYSFTDDYPSFFDDLSFYDDHSSSYTTPPYDHPSFSDDYTPPVIILSSRMRSIDVGLGDKKK